MSIQIKVTEIDRAKKTVLVEAFDGANRILRSPIKYNQETRNSIESVIKKELKVFNRPSYGGMHITFMCRFGESS